MLGEEMMSQPPPRRMRILSSGAIVDRGYLRGGNSELVVCYECALSCR